MREIGLLAAPSLHDPHVLLSQVQLDHFPGLVLIFALYQGFGFTDFFLEPQFVVRRVDPHFSKESDRVYLNGLGGCLELGLAHGQGWQQLSLDGGL